MTDDRADDLTAARSEALSNRARLKEQLAATRDRLQPARLRDDAVGFARGRISDLRHETVAHVRQHPVRTAFGLAALAAWIARKPLLAHAPPALATAYGWLSGHLRFSQHPAEDQAVDSLPGDADDGTGDDETGEGDNDNERILP